MATETLTARVDRLIPPEPQPPQPMDDIMIDIESLSLQPDAVVLSIGAVKFSCQSTCEPRYGDRLLLVPNVLQQIAVGRHVDPKTQTWWAGQPQAASAHWKNPGEDLFVQTALAALSRFTEGYQRIWANGICFDITVLEHLYRQFNLTAPWKYNAVRDARTVYDVGCYGATVPRYLPDDESLTAHHPVDDCISQIRRLWGAGYSR